ncbi:Protein FAR-RED IMPAIRED RESPONSE 1 [Abeliophyllum distichum]|uniref:Protein FAR1-RELATED SEQUENCE n=1 Tax=Abeliophyllum distichum TaxID=126358 RepID=A0ABD1VY09_9LAMI
MPRQAPQIIIIDQDAAIAKVISMVLPFTFHRYCIWHILNKFSEKINVIVYNDEYHMLVNIIKNSESPDEFESHWTTVMENEAFANNEWLCNMFAIRSRWVPVYVNHIFSAGMSSSQRSESNHSFFKRYVTRKNSLMDFITRFNMALRHRRHEELVANHIDISEQPRLTSKFQMENQMVHVYTKKIFLLFQKEIDQSHFYICTKISTFDDFTAVLSTDDSSSTSLMGRHGLLSHKASLIVDDTALTDERSTFLMGEFESLHIRVKEITDGVNIGSTRYKNITRPDSVTIQDPSAVRAKGCGKRLKSAKEKSISKQNRQCGFCGQHGHDKRTCPKRNERSNMDVDQRDDAQDDGTQFVGGDDGTFTSQASSHYDVNWFF